VSTIAYRAALVRKLNQALSRELAHSAPSGTLPDRREGRVEAYSHILCLVDDPGGRMSQAKSSLRPDERGQYRVWCDPCDEEGTFPTLEMAIQARREHLCHNEVASCSWPGWDHS
jgi:hypothetical protein